VSFHLVARASRGLLPARTPRLARRRARRPSALRARSRSRVWPAAGGGA